MTARLRDEHGFTLTELLIGMSVALVVAVGAMGLLLAGQRQQSGEQARVTALDDARDAMAKMTGEIRTAARIDTPAAGASGQVLDVHIPTPTSGTELRLVRYDCSGTSTLGAGLHYCTRAEAPTGTSTTPGSPVRIIDGISNTNVFTVPAVAAGGTPSVTIAIDQRDSGSSSAVSLTETVATRNCTTGVASSLTTC